MKVTPFFAWCDVWIGAYWDRLDRRLYILPLPCLGVRIEFGPEGCDSNPIPGKRPCKFDRKAFTRTGRAGCVYCGKMMETP